MLAILNPIRSTGYNRFNTWADISEIRCDYLCHIFSELLFTIPNELCINRNQHSRLKSN